MGTSAPTVAATEIPAPLATSTPSPTPSPIPTDTPAPTDTLTAQPASTSVEMGASTPTVAATEIPTLPATSTPSPTPSPIPTHSPAPTSTPTAQPAFPTSATVATAPSSSPSPINAQEGSSDPIFLDIDDCQSGIDRSGLPKTEISISTMSRVARVVAEIADTSDERQQGLMCRAVVPEGTGMLFVFEGENRRGFWMFNTYVPLDIVYLDANRGPVKALTMSPCPRPEGLDDVAWRSECVARSSGYGSENPAQFALELPSGWLEQLGIDLHLIGDVTFEW